MATIKRVRTYLWTIDPGYFNLKHAAKTVLAILISLWLVRYEDTVTKIIAGIVSGASMQGLVAKSFFSRLIQIILFDAVYASSLLLGFIIRTSPTWTAITLVGLGFTVNYIRRFGLDNSMAPMVVWVMCFLVTILPFPENIQLWTIVYGVGVGFIVSAVVQIVIFPENDARLFIINANRFFNTLAQGLDEMRRYILVPPKIVNFENLPFVLIKTSLEDLLQSNQAIQQDKIFAEKQEQINHILMQLYALLNAYSLLIHVYRSLWVFKHQISPSSVLALSRLNKQFAKLFSSTYINKNYGVNSNYLPDLLPQLAEQLGKQSFTDPSLIMALLNFKLGFDLLKYHEITLLRGTDAT